MYASVKRKYLLERESRRINRKKTAVEQEVHEIDFPKVGGEGGGTTQISMQYSTYAKYLRHLHTCQ
jgi:hypothetical protein